MAGPAEEAPPASGGSAEHVEPSRKRSGTATSTRTTRTHRSGRSRSASAALLPEALQAHEFPVAEQEPGGMKVVAKHEGAGSLRRIFVGPHFSGQGGKAQAMERRELDVGELSSDSSSSSSDEEHERERVEGKAERARKTASRRGQRLPTGETVHGGFKATGSRKSSMHKWVGGSFEVGGDIREAHAKCELAAKSRAASAVLSQGGSQANDQTFTTARTALPPQGSQSDYRLAQPSPAAEAKLQPSIVHGLLRRPSDIPFTDSASLSAVPDAHSTSPNAPKGILRTKGALLNGSLLGKGHPGSPSLAAPASLRSMPLPMPPPITDRPVKSAHPSGTVKFSQVLEGDQPPAPANEVLARPDIVEPDVPLAFPPRPRKRKDDVLRKERMLMRVDWSAREVSRVGKDLASALTPSYSRRTCPTTLTRTRRGSSRLVTRGGKNLALCGGGITSSCGPSPCVAFASLSRR